MRLKNTALWPSDNNWYAKQQYTRKDNVQKEGKKKKKKTDVPEELAQLKRGVSVCSQVTDDHGNLHSALPSAEDPVPRQLTG